jgi:predicted DNA-binding protein
MSHGGNMSRLKSITLRLPEEEYRAFDSICYEKGYSKTGKIREFIRRLIKDEIESVKISAEEWERVKAGIKEIEKGKFTTFEELKRDFKKRKVGDK